MSAPTARQRNRPPAKLVVTRAVRHLDRVRPLAAAGVVPGRHGEPADRPAGHRQVDLGAQARGRRDDRRAGRRRGRAGRLLRGLRHATRWDRGCGRRAPTGTGCTCSASTGVGEVVDLTAHLDQIEAVARARPARAVVRRPAGGGSAERQDRLPPRPVGQVGVGAAGRHGGSLRLAVLASMHGSKSGHVRAAGRRRQRSVSPGSRVRSWCSASTRSDERGSRGPARILGTPSATSARSNARASVGACRHLRCPATSRARPSRRRGAARRRVRRERRRAHPAGRPHGERAPEAFRFLQRPAG